MSKGSRPPVYLERLKELKLSRGAGGLVGKIVGQCSFCKVALLPGNNTAQSEETHVDSPPSCAETFPHPDQMTEQEGSKKKKGLKGTH